MLTAELVSQVKRIQVHTGRQVADVLAGAYHSVFKGRGMEFEEVRPYVPGDDVRSIDWNVTARVGAPYIKRYVEERELSVLLVVDISGSQDFGSGERSKREAAALLSALIAFSAIHNHDKVGLLLFRDGAEDYIPPRKGQRHALRVVREVLAAGQDSKRSWRNRFDLPLSIVKRFFRLRSRTSGAAQNSGSAGDAKKGTAGMRPSDIGHALEFCRRVLTRKAVIFVVSDFLDDGYVPILRSANRRHDVVCVRMVDRRENELEASGLIALEDAETGKTRLLDTRSKAVRDALATAAEERREAITKTFRGSGIDTIEIDAAGSVIDPLVSFFRMRERRLKR